MSKIYPFVDQSIIDRSLRSYSRSKLIDTMGFLQRNFGLRRHLDRGRVHILCLHTIFSDEIEPFRRLVAALSNYFSFISFSESMRRVAMGGLEKPLLVFTFDDGMRNNLRAAKVLEDFGTTGLFFVCPSIVGERDPKRIEDFCRKRLYGSVVEFLDWNDLEQLISRGHEIGSHTASHRRLSELSEEDIKEELIGSREILIARLGSCAHFAWPYGTMRDVPANLGQLVHEAGYATCSSAIRGCHVERSDTKPSGFCVRRENIIASWHVEHVLTFLCRSSAVADHRNNYWP